LYLHLYTPVQLFTPSHLQCKPVVCVVSRPIPADMFENHIRQLSLDDNRGFSEEYKVKNTQ